MVKALFSSRGAYLIPGTPEDGLMEEGFFIKLDGESTYESFSFLFTLEGVPKKLCPICVAAVEEP